MNAMLSRSSGSSSTCTTSGRNNSTLAGSGKSTRPYPWSKLPYARQQPLRASIPAATGACTRPCQQEQQCTCGIVIVDHGSRRKASNDMLVEFCQLYQHLTKHPIVEPAHMEIAEPTIEQAVGRCVAAGATQVVVAPYFLSKGRHIQDDIPALVAAAQQQFPGVQCSIAEPIGIDPLMVQLIQNRVTAALVNSCPAAAGAAAAADGQLSSPVAALTQQHS